MARELLAECLPWSHDNDREVLAKICCTCEGTLVPGTVAIAPDVDRPYDPTSDPGGTPRHHVDPRQSQCPQGSLILALWHTHPSGVASQMGSQSADLMTLNGYEQSEQACAGIVSYMSNSAGHITRLDTSGNEVDL